jgi:anti-sigma factor RsiW
MTCEKIAEVHAYHDGELDSGRRVALEAHLAVCAECRELLSELEGLSAFLARAPLPVMPERAVSRFHGSWYEARDRGMVRVASWMTAVAAMLLVGALLAQPTAPATGQTKTGPVKAGPWETFAIAPPAEVHGESGATSELVQVAQWMADDLSVGEGGRR